MKQVINIILFSALGFLMIANVGCTDTKSKTEEKVMVQSDGLLTSVEGSNLLSSNCYICHNPNTSSHDEILAPPLAGIKKRYIRESKDRADFVDRMAGFVANPREEVALMKGPIRRFGLMPKTTLSMEEIGAIVGFIHDNEIPEPSWFANHEKEMHKD
ncbi:MAG: hypothetical protein RIA69_01280 [Cyclobacteriaceae bacterium]